jgi:predicted dehydrogenase
MFKAAIIGAGGYWAKNIIRTLLENQDVQITVLCDTNIEAAKLVAKKFRLTEALVCSDFAHYSIGKKEFQEANGIFIITPPTTHHGIAQYFLSIGKNCLVEKPLTTNSKEAQELCDLAEKNKCVLMVGHTFLYNPAVLKIKELIDNKEYFGNIIYMYFHRLNLGQVKEDINVVWSIMPHDITIANFLMGSTPEKITASGLKYTKMYDTVFTTLYYPNNKLAHIHNSWIDPLKVRRCVIVGERKMIVYDDVSNEFKIMVYDKGIDYIPKEGEQAYDIKLRAGDTFIPKISTEEPLKREINHFVDCVLNNKNPITNGYDGLSVVKILEQIQANIMNNQQCP